MVIGVKQQPCWSRSLPTRSSPFNSSAFRSGITSSSSYYLAGDPFSQSTSAMPSSSWNSGDYPSGTLDDAFAALNLGNGYYEQRQDIGGGGRSFRQQPPPPSPAAASGGFGFNVGHYSSSSPSDPLAPSACVLLNEKISNFGSSKILNEQLFMLQMQQLQLQQQLSSSSIRVGRGGSDHVPSLSNPYYPFLPCDESSSSASSSSSYYDPQNLISPAYGQFHGGSVCGSGGGEPVMGMGMRVDDSASYLPSGSSSNYTNQYLLLGRQQERQMSYFSAKSAASNAARNLLNGNGNMLGHSRNSISGSSGGSNSQRRHGGWQRSALNPDLIRIADLKGFLGNWARDSEKCKLLQDKLKDHPTGEDVAMVLSELIDSIPELMKHDIGNYLVQKLIEISDVGQRTRILLSLTASRLQLLTVCFNSHGTRAVQKLLENLTTEQQKSSFITALTQCAVSLAKDMNGHHVIQHCLKHFSPKENMFLLHEIAQNCYEVGTDKSGCCVLQQCIEYSQGDSRNHLLSEVVANSLTLSENRYGNYVVQFALGLKDPVVTGNIIKQLKGSFVMLSCNKFASNVVEKCLKETERNESEAVILELISGHDTSKLFLDPYGNFVIQSALEVSEGAIHSALLGLIEISLPSMRSNMYGRKVIAWLNKQGFTLV